MARKPIIAGNWKMNLTAVETRSMLAELKTAVAAATAVDIVVVPTFTSLATACEALEGSNVALGAQNVHWESNGAYTGEISVAMLKEIPVEYVIVGHSERRQYFGESDATVNQRAHAALAGGLTPIVCFGESLAQREAGSTESVVASQIELGLAGFDASNLDQLVLAYEPVWAIGTGVTASPAQAQEVHAFVRGKLRESFGDVADRVRIQYGGSVKPTNAAELLACADIDGALVGGASLKAADFAGIVTAV